MSGRAWWRAAIPAALLCLAVPPAARGQEPGSGPGGEPADRSLLGTAEPAEKPPSRLKVLGLSLLLPGLGHEVLGERSRAQGLWIAEAGIWGAFGVFELQGHVRKDSYVEMAEVFAGVRDASGRSGDYYQLLGDYRSSEDYNDEIRRDARARVGDDLEAREAYFQRYRIPDDRAWEWSSFESWRRYRDKRGDSSRAFKRARYMIGFAVANRLLSAVDAIRIHGKRQGSTSVGFSFVPDPEELTGPPRLCVTLRFP